MIFGFWAMALLSRPCHDPVNANVSCHEHFLLFSTSKINPSMMIQLQFGNWSSTTAIQWPLYRPYDVITYDHMVIWSYTVMTLLWVMNIDRSELEQCVRFVVFVLSRCICWYATWPTWVIYQVTLFDMTTGQIFSLVFLGQNAFVSMLPDVAG